MTNGPNHEISVVTIGVAAADPPIVIRVRGISQLFKSSYVEARLCCLIIAVNVSSGVAEACIDF